MVGSTTPGVMIEIVDPQTAYAVVIDDDGRVAYGYLRDQQRRIVGDVWLYNVADSPEQPEWQDPQGSPPFLNARRYVRESPPTRIRRSEDVSVQWDKEDGVRASIFVDGGRYAVLREGAKPGWSAGALQDGPLAKVLT